MLDRQEGQSNYEDLICSSAHRRFFLIRSGMGSSYGQRAIHSSHSEQRLAFSMAPTENLVIGSSDVLDTLPLFLVKLPTILKELPMLHTHVMSFLETGNTKLVNFWLIGICPPFYLG